MPWTIPRTLRPTSCVHKFKFDNQCQGHLVGKIFMEITTTLKYTLCIRRNMTLIPKCISIIHTMHTNLNLGLSMSTLCSMKVIVSFGLELLQKRGAQKNQAQNKNTGLFPLGHFPTTVAIYEPRRSVQSGHSRSMVRNVHRYAQVLASEGLSTAISSAHTKYNKYINK